MGAVSEERPDAGQAAVRSIAALPGSCVAIDLTGGLARPWSPQCLGSSANSLPNT
jgi:hypothetical protein